MELEVGRVIRSSTTRFAAGCQVLRPEVPVFGALVKARTQGDDEVFGLIYDVRIEDDPFVRQMAAAPDELRPEYIEDMRLNRQQPIEVGVLVVGHRQGGRIHHRLPPQPPLSLDAIHTCSTTELTEFTAHLDYFPLILENRDLPSDELLASHLRHAAEARGAGRQGFMLAAGRELARLLALEPLRLDGILRRIRP